MKTVDRICEELKAIKEKWPGGRIGQILINATGGQDFFFMEDEELLKILVNFRGTMIVHRGELGKEEANLD